MGTSSDEGSTHCGLSRSLTLRSLADPAPSFAGFIVFGDRKISRRHEAILAVLWPAMGRRYGPLELNSVVSSTLCCAGSPIKISNVLNILQISGAEMDDDQRTCRAPPQERAANPRQKKPWATPRLIESELEETEHAIGHGGDGAISTNS